MTHAADSRMPATPTSRPAPDHTVPALVEATAARLPHAVAVARGTRTCTYERLVARYTATARALPAAGVTPGEVVAVRGGRSVETVVAMLGVLRAGAVLTMIDVAQPEGRVRDVIASARPRLVVDTTEDEPPLDAGVGRTVRLAELERPVAGGAALPVLDAESPAYLCFTSGTTGEPRGVLGGHGPLTHFCAWEQDALGLGEGDRVAQMAALTFDAVFKDLFPALIGGATVCLPPTDRPFVDVAKVVNWLGEDRVSVVQTVPSVLSALLAELPAGTAFPSMRLICLSGEPLPGSLVNRWRKATGTPGTRFVNLYGTTEATILKAWYPVPDGEVDSGILPVGKAIDGAELLVVNKRGRRCGVGEPGEVLIRTPYLTRGAWRPAEGAAPLFEVNPLNPDDPTDLVQRTGDLGRIGPRGDLEIHGRVDDQVKVLGIRVHPAEVGAVIRRLPAVEDAAVVVRPGDEGPVLVAYVVPAPGAAQDAQAVRGHVARHGSHAMVPAHVVFLERLPLTGHGKLDRSALPEPGAPKERTDEGTDDGEWTDTERRVAALWSEAFKKEITSRHGNFFELGGHSLMMARLLARIRRTFGVALSLPTLFESSTIARLAAAVDAASRSGEPTEDPLPVATVSGADQPLSPEQEGLWFLHRLDPGSSAYNMAGVFRLPPEVEEEAVRAAFLTVCGRHEALRLRFREVDGRPVQTEAEAAVDFAGLTTADDRPSGLAALTARSAVAFDLAAGPPVRVRTVRVPGAELLVGLTIHHLCCDGVSWSLIAQQVDGLLAGTGRQARPEVSGPRPRFADYAAWRARRTAGERAEADLAFWRDLLGDAPAVDLPRGRPVPGVRPHQARVRRITVDSAVTGRLAALCARAEATEYMAMMTVLALALARAATQEQIVIGGDSVGRDREELEEVIGFFVRTHAYRFDMSGDPTFEEALGRVRAVLVEAAGHRDVSFAQVVEAVAATRGGGDRSALFNVMLRMPPRDELPREAAVLRSVDVVAGAGDGSGAAPTAKFDLTVVVRPGQAGTVLDLEYDADAVQEEFVDALGERLTRLLRFATERPATPLSRIGREAHPFGSKLVAEERVPVAERFRGHAAATPDAVAVSWTEGEVTYRQLADAVAGAERVMEPGEKIGVMGGKSPATVAALVAALSAGAVPLLLDENLPGPRRASMVEKAAVRRVLLTGPTTVTDVPVNAVVERVTFDELAAAAGAGGVTGRSSARPQDPAYIFFTSGTTGEAKGVVGSRRGLDHFIDWETAEFGVHAGDRVAQLTTLSFDAVLRDVFVPLTRGATLCLPPAAALDDTARIREWLERERITVLHTTPSVVASWLREAGAGAPPLTHLRLLCLAGEPLTGRSVQELRERLLGPRTEIVNFYGPTETTMIKTFLRVAPGQDAGPVPVGLPLPGTQAVVQGADGYVCGPGERGEIVIRTPYRTLGYLGDTGAASPFHRNPLSDDPHDLLYATGDLAVVGARGEILIEGRRDDLLKVRGVRVHPAEISAELASHPGVQQVHVDADQDSALVAYVVRAPGADLTTESLRGYARERLPLAVVPGLFLFVERFALLPNGKLDRASLTGAPARTTEERVEPRDATESEISSLWAGLLGHRDFGVTDDFFAVGGHSLLATILLTRLRKKTGISLSLRRLLEAPRVDRLAEMVRDLTAGTPEHVSDVLLPLRQGRPGGPLLFVVHPIGGDVLCFRDLATALPPEITVIGVRSPGLETGTPPTTVQEIAAAYLHEVHKAQPEGPYHFAGWSMGGVVAYEMARQLSFEGVRTASLVLIDSYAPGSGAFDHFADPDTDRVRSFARDLERMTGEQIDTGILTGERPAAGEEEESLRRRFRVFDAHATALVGYRLRRARLRDTRTALVLAGDQRRPDGVTETLGWAEALGVNVETRTVPGADHFTVVRPPAAGALAGEVARVIASGAAEPDGERA